MPEWKDEDGWRKNLAKFRSEWKLLRIGMSPQWTRLRQSPDAHSYVNLYVEAFRLSPYLWGHLAAVAVPVAFFYSLWAVFT